MLQSTCTSCSLRTPADRTFCCWRQFVVHAAKQFQPRIMVLIAPANTVVPRGYQVNMCRMCSSGDVILLIPRQFSKGLCKLTSPVLVCPTDCVREPPAHSKPRVLCSRRQGGQLEQGACCFTERPLLHCQPRALHTFSAERGRLSINQPKVE